MYVLVSDRREHQSVVTERANHALGTLAALGRISPRDVSSEMVGREFSVTQPFTTFTAGPIPIPITLSIGDQVSVISWDNDATTTHVRRAMIYFDIPKRFLRPVAPIQALARYSAGLDEVIRALERGNRAMTGERGRPRGARRGELSRLEHLQRNRERLLNKRLIQEFMFNRFDPIIRKWTDYYNTRSSLSAARSLHPDLVKSMLFQESEMGTAGEHLEDPPGTPTRSRFNIGQVIDSDASALLIMIREMQPDLISAYHLQDIERDTARANQSLTTLTSRPTLTPPQQARLDHLRRLLYQARRLGRRFEEVFLWEYPGFGIAVDELFRSGTPPLNLTYEFWIRTAIRWIFEKHKAISSWPEAIRAYNGSGPAARRYRDHVVARAREAVAAQTAGRQYIPGR